MTTLSIIVEWLGGAYHGREWPPSPYRLYQAMRAGYAVHRRGDPAFEAALHHLETLPAPTITAPVIESETVVTASVSSNDGNRVLALRARTARARTALTRDAHPCSPGASHRGVVEEGGFRSSGCTR